jgi:hypothetical protein
MCVQEWRRGRGSIFLSSCHLWHKFVGTGVLVLKLVLILIYLFSWMPAFAGMTMQNHKYLRRKVFIDGG